MMDRRKRAHTALVLAEKYASLSPYFFVRGWEIVIFPQTICSQENIMMRKPMAISVFNQIGGMMTIAATAGDMIFK
ncbi:Uncharacterised protein [Mycobacteroides abscessus subsp. abscessus]|nr:Uncharacterised protein [Mycobacteroides abscessus subsp. abscessus]